jgi:hypothetical protein
MLVSRYGQTSSGLPNTSASAPADPNVKAAIQALETALGTKVAIHEVQGKGKIEIHFYSPEELNRLYEGLIRVKF